MVGFFGFLYYAFTQLEGITAGKFSQAGLVSETDLIFALTSLTLSSIAWMQTFIYPSERHSTITVTVIIVSFAFFFALCFYTSLTGEKQNLITPIALAAIFKAISSGSKYSYQVVLNYQKKST
jgi:hypothetical protein